MSMPWPPAAETTIARLASSWSYTSAKSGPGAPGASGATTGGGVGAGESRATPDLSSPRVLIPLIPALRSAGSGPKEEKTSSSPSPWASPW